MNGKDTGPFLVKASTGRPMEPPVPKTCQMYTNPRKGHGRNLHKMSSYREMYCLVYRRSSTDEFSIFSCSPWPLAVQHPLCSSQRFFLGQESYVVVEEKTGCKAQLSQQVVWWLGCWPPILPTVVPLPDLQLILSLFLSPTPSLSGEHMCLITN